MNPVDQYFLTDPQRAVLEDARASVVKGGLFEKLNLATGESDWVCPVHGVCHDNKVVHWLVLTGGLSVAGVQPERTVHITGAGMACLEKIEGQV